MANSGQETEAKFYVLDLRRLERQLQDLGARLVQSRLLEKNIRFDLPDARLRAESRVLRLRQDTEARLTYKSASSDQDGVLSRREIEFIVEDFEKPKAFLEALGYRSIFYYEKHRAIYTLDSERLGATSQKPPAQHQTCHIMLDELPYGNFVEIEGESIESIRRVSDALDLDWDAAIGTSYYALFERARQALSLTARDLSFEEFAGIRAGPEHLGVRAADQRA